MPQANYNNQRNNNNQRHDSTPFRFEIQKFLDESGLVQKTLISSDGDNNVRDLAEYLARDEGESKKISVNQVRKFYDTFLKIYYNESVSDEKKIQLIMLKAQVEYAVKRLKIHNFGKFFSNRISVLVKEDFVSFEKNLDAFKLHFEALIGYFPK